MPAQKVKKRLILNQRHVNKQIFKEKIRFDDWKVIILADQGLFLLNLTLNKATITLRYIPSLQNIKLFVEKENFM